MGTLISTEYFIDIQLKEKKLITNRKAVTLYHGVRNFFHGVSHSKARGQSVNAYSPFNTAHTMKIIRYYVGGLTDASEFFRIIVVLVFGF